MTTRVRFAPSPTGLLHVGNIRTALLNWLFACKTGGRFLLRFDDTDVERSTREFADAIAEDLAWLGIEPHEVARQSERIGRYDEAAAGLKASERLYACYETAEELDRKRKLQHARGLPPVYDRAALKLTAEEHNVFADRGIAPHWRFRLEQRPVTWTDLIRGEQSIDAASLSDPVLVRADGSYLYTLTSVVDDIDFRITHVVRGEDHVANTAVQIQIFEALGAVLPVFGHHNLLVGADGQGLSKRLGSLSIRHLREAGFEPMAVASHAATIGTSDPVAPHAWMEELVIAFDFAKLSRAPARFDEAELRGLNTKLLHMLPIELVSGRLAELCPGAGDDFWRAVRGNIDVLPDVVRWWRCVTGPVVPVIEDALVCQTAAIVLPPEPWSESTWGEWTKAVAEATGTKGRGLFMPLRKALTGLDHGPELRLLLPMIGRDKVLARLAGKTA
jgi:glutamyl-tRNA synthetase